jgi:hypothetical protein
MKLNRIPLCALACLLALSASAAPRTWMAADGRAIEAEYVGRGADGSALVLVRADTKTRVTVPLTALSAADQTFAATLPTAKAPEDKPPAPPAKKEPSPALVALAKSWPAPVTLAYGGALEGSKMHPDLVELHRRYQRDLDVILSGDPATNCRTLRTRIERDSKILLSDSQMKLDSNTTGERLRMAQAKINAARSGYVWISVKLVGHLDKIEAELAKQDAQSLAANP